ncbi:MAG: CcmD family protein [Vicinamibacterales bacterium]
MRYLRLLIIVGCCALPALVSGQPVPSPDEFVPISEIPPQEQIPAINLVAAAYAFVWVALFGYVWSLGARLGKAETDLARLERKDH